MYGQWYMYGIYLVPVQGPAVPSIYNHQCEWMRTRGDNFRVNRLWSAAPQGPEDEKLVIC